jgi:hypothetical protein
VVGGAFNYRIVPEAWQPGKSTKFTSPAILQAWTIVYESSRVLGHLSRSATVKKIVRVEEPLSRQ